ncbi:hypothetical protein Tco_0629700 [Tanacetum coccineum]|uniref:Transposase-associated domain-containing protein n=1 Tax=Tanacetum coccineum TaxID=301880 RepID=A0ABQ4WU02_9ASTR
MSPGNVARDLSAEFIAEPTTADKTNHSKSGLGLPSIVALVMVIDKSWTSLGKHEKAFYTGLKKFVDDCKPLVDSAGNIRCPCKSCRLVLWVSIKHLSDHISKYGFDPSYKTWIHHGEPDLPPPPPVIDNTRQPQMSDMTACLNDSSYIPLNNEQNKPTQGDIGETSNDPTQAKRNEFEELYASSNEELYPGCNHVTRLDFMAKFTYFKVNGKLTDSIFNEMLEFFQIVFPAAKGYKLPPSYYAIKKTFKIIGLGDQRITLKSLIVPVCKRVRWKNDPKRQRGRKFANKNDKSKDTLKARQDLQTLGVRKELESFDNVCGNELFPSYTLKKKSDRRRSCSEELFSLACGPTSACTYPACIVNGVKFVVHERDILHTTQNSGVSTPRLDGEMYYGQLEEILELTYIGPRKVVLFRCKWEFHQNTNTSCDTSNTSIPTLKTLARRHSLVRSIFSNMFSSRCGESDQDVIHGSSSSHVTLFVGLTCLEHTDLSINAQSTEVDAPPVNDDNANANEDNADFINNEDDSVAHVLDDDDVVVSDDDEMACVAPRSHRWDVGVVHLVQPTRRSMLRLKTGNWSLRMAFRENNEQPLTIGFDYEDLGTFHPLGNYSGMLNSLMGETVRPLPLACEWEEIPEAYKAHIYPTLEKVDKGYYEDLIETWRKGHSNKKTGEFKTKENEQRYVLDMKAMKDKITAGLIPFKIDQEILDEIIPSDNCQNMSGMGRKLPGGGSTSRKRANRAFGDIMTPDQITQMFRQQEQEKIEQLAQDLARENNNESSSGEEEEGEQQSGGDDDYSDEDE